MLNIEEIITKQFIKEEYNCNIEKENIYNFAFNLSPHFAQELVNLLHRYDVAKEKQLRQMCEYSINFIKNIFK